LGEKIQRNIVRDAEVNKTLADYGWLVKRFTDTEISKNTDGCVPTIVDLIAGTKEKKNDYTMTGKFI